MAMPAAAPAAPYRIDHDHSAITFSADHLGFSRFFGRFNSWRGEIDFDPGDVEATRIRIEIDAASFDTGSRIRDENTKQFPDMLNVSAFPLITFASTRVVMTSAETVRIEGDLTIRDVTLPVAFDARLNARGVTPISGGREVFGFTATGEVDRVAFGIGFAAPAVSGVIPVRVDIEMWAAD
jgi:polyisoprenoid-binding protein YceI